MQTPIRSYDSGSIMVTIDLIPCFSEHVFLMIYRGEVNLSRLSFPIDHLNGSSSICEDNNNK